MYLNPRPAVYELERIYPSDYHAYEFTPEAFGLVHAVRRKLEARRLLACCRGLPAGARILDVGCGDGFHLALLRDFGSRDWQLEGVDVAPRAVAAARGRPACSCIRERFEDAGLAAASYDLVFLIATIEHVADPAGMLKAVRRILRPGGRAVVITDSTDTLDFTLFRRRHWGGYHFPRHWSLFNRKSLALLAAKCGAGDGCDREHDQPRELGVLDPQSAGRFPCPPVADGTVQLESADRSGNIHARGCHVSSLRARSLDAHDRQAAA